MADGTVRTVHALGFEGLYRRYRRYVVGALRWHRVPDADVEDAAHEVFLVLLRKLDAHVEPEMIRPWLFQVARRVASNHRRARHRHARKLTNDWREVDEASPESGVIRREGIELVTRFLEALDPLTCRVFVLAELEGLRGAEIADRLDVPLHAVYPRLRRARRRLTLMVEREHGKLRSWFPPGWLGSLWRQLGSTFAGTLALGLCMPIVSADDPLPLDTADEASSAQVVGLPFVVPWAEPAPHGDDGHETSIARRPRRVDRSSRTSPAPTDARPLALPAPTSSWKPVDAEVHLKSLLTPPRPAAKPAPAPAPPGLHGLVVDTNGRALANAHVYCRRVDGPRRRPCPRSRVQTDREGRFALGSLVAGEYELVAFRRGTNATAGSDLVVELDGDAAAVRLVAE